MKALSTTILIVVTAVVILVAALVLLTIFSGGIGNVGTMTNQKNSCITQCVMTCETMNTMPPTWGATGCSQFTDISKTTCHCCEAAGQTWCKKSNSCAVECK